MTRLLVRDLAPGTSYYFQVREVTPDEQSQWSPRLLVQTAQDNSEPAAPTGVQWNAVGRNFNASWNATTTLVSGEPLNNLSHYEVRVSHTASGQSKTYDVTGRTFEFTYEMNETAFAGARSPVVFEVRAVTNTGRTSLYTNPTSATNPVPAAVTNLTATDAIEAIGLKWTGAADNDLVGYNIYASQSNGFTPGPANKVATVNTTQYIHYTTSTAPWYFHVRSVDIFQQESTSSQVTGTAKTAAGGDTTPPAGPTNVTTTMGFDATRQTAYVTVAWTASVDTDVRNYRIRYAPGAASNWNYVTVPGDQTSVRIDIDPATAYYIAAQAIDFSNNASAFVNSTTYPHTSLADTTAPSTPNAPTAANNTMQVQVTHNNKKADGVTNMEADVEYYDVYASTTTGFTPAAANHIGKLVKSTVTSQVFPLPAAGNGANQTWYIKVIAVDRSGNVSAASAQTSANPTLIAATNIVDATITSAKIVTLNADKIAAGSGIIQNLVIGNASQSGSISSYGYVAGSTGWQLAKTTLEINDGTIKARALELRNGGNLLPPIYNDFEGAVSVYEPVSGEPSKIFGINSTWSIIGIPGKYGTQGLRVSTLGGAQGGVALSTVIGADPYNINVEAMREYIVSAYLRSDDAVKPTLRFGAYFNDETSILNDTGSVVTDTYTRYWWRFTAPVTADSCYITIYTAGTTAATFDVDGVQVEERIGKLTTPSQWLPASSTTIDGGQVKTGSIQSNSTIFVNGMEVPAWYIDLSGRAQFSDASVLGALNIGTEQESQGASYVQSRNYSADLELGWRIDSSGSAYFYDANIIGSIRATSAEIVGSLSVTGVGSLPATVDFGNSTTATLASAVSAPPGQPIITPLDWTLTTIPIVTDQNSIHSRLHGPVVNSTGDYTYVLLANTAGNVIATFYKVSAAGVLISTTPTTITTWDVNDPTHEIVGFSCYDGTNYSLQFRRSQYETTYRHATFNATYALTAHAAISLTDEFNETLWGDTKPYFERVGNSMYILRCRSTNNRENLVRNPTMSHSDPDKFYRGYNATSLSRDTAGNSHGTYGLRLISTGSTDVKGFEVFHADKGSGYNERSCKPGDYIYYHVDSRSSSDISSAEMQVSIYYNDSAMVDRGDWSPLSSSAIREFVGYFVVPEGAHHFKMMFRIRKTSGTNISDGLSIGYFDALRITNNGPKPYIGEFNYADGNSTDWFWSGDVNDSVSTAGVNEGVSILRKYTVGSESSGFLWWNEDDTYIGQSIAGLKIGAGDFGSGSYYAFVTEGYTGSATHNANFFVGRNLEGGGTGNIFEWTQTPFGPLATINNRYYVQDRARTKLARLERNFMGHYLDSDGIITTNINFAYTYYDSNATGGTHETPLGPVLVWNAAGHFRKPWRISGVKLPVLPPTVAAEDKPNQIGFYASYGSDRQGRTYMNRLAYMTPTADGVADTLVLNTTILGNTSSTGTMNTSNPLIVNTPGTVPSQAPSSNQFIGIAGFVPAVLQSQALNGVGNPLVKISGDGTAVISSMKFLTTGITLTDDAGAPAGNLKTETGGFELYYDATGQWHKSKPKPFVNYVIGTSNSYDSTGDNITGWVEHAGYSNNQGYFTLTGGTTVTVQVAGWYRVSAWITNDSTHTSNSTHWINIMMNGSAVVSGESAVVAGEHGSHQALPRTFQCEAGDQFVVQMDCTGSGVYSVRTEDRLGGFFFEYLGPA